MAGSRRARAALLSWAAARAWIDTDRRLTWTFALRMPSTSVTAARSGGGNAAAGEGHVVWGGAVLSDSHAGDSGRFEFGDQQ